MKKICVTGASGFIAMRIIADLIGSNYAVRGTLRNLDRSMAIQSDIEKHLGRSISIDFVQADLTDDQGWERAFKDCDAIMHVACPFPAKPFKDAKDMMEPAIDGTIRVLKAALNQNVKRVIMTSSNAAIWYGNFDTNHYDDSTWTNIEHSHIDDYTKAKAIAEQKAWEFAKSHPQLQLTSINPSVVWGPGIGNHLNSTSISLFKMVLKKEMPMLPNMKVPFVDIRDVVKIHCNALENDASIGKRFLVTSDPAWMIDVSNTVRSLGYDTPKKVAPNFMIKLMSNFDKSAKSLIPLLGHDYYLDPANARDVFGFLPTPFETTFKDTADYINACLA
tara:strand:- start:338 stop:1336 length:999 start_codon:yes stop_codon:yes gene_type:complete